MTILGRRSLRETTVGRRSLRETTVGRHSLRETTVGRHSLRETTMGRRSLLKAVAFGVVAAMERPAIGRAEPNDGVILTSLPGDGNQLALTIDDGTNTAVVAAFAQFCRDSGVRLTFFPNGVNESWTVNAGMLRPMVESGQIQLGNHTWSHPAITDLPLTGVADQIRRNGDFLRNTYGVDGTPFFRPPFGLRNADTDRVATDLGYSMITLWSATIGDSVPENATQLVKSAQTNFRPQQIVLGHANTPPVLQTYSQLLDIIHERGLQTVTLADVFR